MAQTSQLFRRHLPRGHVEGFRAAKHVWTCDGCGYQRLENPYAKPHTRSSPAECYMCKSSKWTHSASRSEARRYAELIALQRQGVIRNLRHPPPGFEILTHNDAELISLMRKGISATTASFNKIATYTADFDYDERGTNDEWRHVVEDHKPRADLTKLAELLHTLVWHQHGIAIRVTYYNRNRIVVKGDE